MIRKEWISRKMNQPTNQPLLSLFKNSFGIEYPTKVDMPLNKET